MDNNIKLKTKKMKKIDKVFIEGFLFELNNETKEFELKGEIIPEYCRIIQCTYKNDKKTNHQSKHCYQRNSRKA
jgi:hypothetical protein